MLLYAENALIGAFLSRCVFAVRLSDVPPVAENRFEAILNPKIGTPWGKRFRVSNIHSTLQITKVPFIRLAFGWADFVEIVLLLNECILYFI